MPQEQKAKSRLEIAHILFIDIVGYSKLLANEQRASIDLLNQVVRQTERFGSADEAGALEKIPTGDGMALVFQDSPESPVECASEISRALREYPQLRVRMGVHSGPVSAVTDVAGRGNLSGAGMNIAQRVMDCADAGQILLSKHVADDLESDNRWRPCLHDLGECEVKHGVRVHLFNLHGEDFGHAALPSRLRTVRTETRRRIRKRWVAAAFAAALLVVFVGCLIWHSAKAVPSSGAEKSIAVLPFADLSQAKDQEYFCDGMSEELLDSLAKIEGLRVVARTSSFAFKGQQVDAAEIAQKLGVQHLLEGSLRRDGNRIRITAQLINARDGFHLWSETFERELQGVFAVQDEITHAIVEKLKVRLALVPPTRASENAEAHDLYLRGLYFSNKSSEEELRRALGFFQEALQRDSNLSRAWTGIAKVWLWLADEYVKPLEALPLMEAAANKALALNPNDAEARCHLGEAKWFLNWDPVSAETEIERALALDPNCLAAHLLLALLKPQRGDCAAAIAHIRAAEKLDPLSIDVADRQRSLMIRCNRLDEALAAAQRMEELDPGYSYGESPLARVYYAQGKLEEALALYRKAAEQRGRPAAGLALTYASLGRVAEARAILEQLLERRKSRYLRADTLATIYAALGEREESFAWLETAYQEHSSSLVRIVFRSEFKALQSDPRFAEMVRRIGLDPAVVLNRQ